MRYKSSFIISLTPVKFDDVVGHASEDFLSFQYKDVP